MTNLLSPRAQRFMATRGRRHTTFNEDGIRSVLRQKGIAEEGSEPLVEYLKDYAGYEIDCLHDCVWLTPTSLEHFVDDKGNDLSLANLLEYMDGRWWLEGIQSFHGVEPFYIDLSGRVFWHWDMDACMASSVTKYIEGMAFVDIVADWLSPWYQVVENLDSDRIDDVCDRLWLSEYLPASDQYRRYWGSDTLLVQITRMHQKQPSVAVLWGFSKDRDELQTLLDELADVRADKRGPTWMDDAMVRWTYARDCRRGGPEATSESR